jgi:exoribonuclease-2
LKEKSLVVYKGKPAIVREAGDKIEIELPDGSRPRVRAKDIELLHPGPLDNFAPLDAGFSESVAREAWELAAEERALFTLEELASLAGDWTPQNAWAVYQLLQDGLYFEGGTDAIRAKPAESVALETQKRQAKHEESALRDVFLTRLRNKERIEADDRRFLQDVEALALGKTEKSRTLKDLRLEETPENAHRLLLDTGVWTVWINPHPSRWGTPLAPPKAGLNAPPDEERADLTGLDAFAIDDAASADPDDAISLEMTAEGRVLYVHIADPSASAAPDSPADVEARSRGATLYAPEGASRMLCDAALSHFALGLDALSPALSVRITLDNSGCPGDIRIFRSRIRVTRLTYAAAVSHDALAPLFTFAKENTRRREAAGAVCINFPEVSIAVSDEQISIEPLENYPSRALVRECMLVAGEAAALWALEKRLPFPFISQEVENPPRDLLPGYAGAYQMRRCMRSRTLSTKPGLHQGLGLDLYTQITSPLRRYTDLLAHQQISAVLRRETPLDEERLLARLAAAERAAIAVTRAERSSRAYWTAVYLADKTGSLWEGIILELRGPHAVALIPALGLEIQTALKHGAPVEPNAPCTLKLGAVKIPEAETRWTMV